MGVEIRIDGAVLTARLSGDIDHHSASGIRSEIDRAIKSEAVSEVRLDFADVTFMDSSGIGLVMGRYKLINDLGGVCRIISPPAYISRVMKLAGIDRICEIINEGGVRL